MRIGDYLIGPSIGSGATSVVYRAQKDALSFALKLMKPVTQSEEALKASLLLRKEASVIARLSHPNLVRVVEVGEHERQVYVVMELVETGSLTDVISRQKQLDEATVLLLARKLASVLVPVHRMGLVHRDIKPDNILFDGKEAVKLIDFGFAAEDEASSRAKADIVGSFMYCAPEQSGMLKLPVTSRSDLYALGAVLFEALAGRPVFEGTSAFELMQKHASAPVPDLLSLRPDTRPILASIIAKLLSKDPDDRYQTAEGLLADIENISALETAARDGGAVKLDARQSAIRVSHEVPLVGRDAELKRINETWNKSLAGHGTVLQIEGEGGLGKTRLTQELLVKASAGDGIILRAKCQQGEAVPFGVLREAIDEYIVRLLKLPEGEREPKLDVIRKAAGEMAPVIKRLSRGLERVLNNTEEALVLDPVSEQARFYDNIMELIRRLAELSGPLMLLIDDIQWLDASSLEVIKRLAMAMKHTRLMVLTTARNDPASTPATNLFVGEVGPNVIERIILKPLEAAAVGLFVKAFLGGNELETAIIERLTAVTNGNVFAVSEYVRSMLDSGALSPSAGQWKVDTEQFAKLTLSNNVLQLVANRIKLLSSETLAVLGVAAVHGNVFTSDLLLAATGQGANKVRFALEEASRATLIEHQEGETYAFVHDRVREALLESLTAEQLKDHHQALGDAMLKKRDEAAEYLFSLARHFVAGHAEKHAEEVYNTCLEAGQVALDNYANTTAYELLSHAQQAKHRLILNGGVLVETIELDEALGKASSRIGKLKEAHEHFSKCLRRARTVSELARIHLQISSTYLNEGNPGEAWISLEKCLQTVGRPYPSNLFLLTLSMSWLWLWGIFLDKTGIGFGRSRRKARDFRETLSQIVPLASGINMYLGRQDRGGYFIIRDFANTHFLGVGKERARSTIYYAYFIGFLHANAFRSRSPFFLLSLRRRRSIAQHYFKRAVNLAEQAGDKAILAFCHYVGPQAYGSIGDIVEGEKLLRESLPLQKKYAGAYYPAVTIMVNMLYLCWRGLSREAVDLALAEQETMERSENLLLQQLVLGMCYSQLCILGRMPEAMKIRDKWLGIARQSPKFDFAQSEVWSQNLLVLLDLRDLGAEAEKYIEDFRKLRIYLHFNMHVNTYIGHVRFQQFLRKPDGVEERRNLKLAMSEVRHFEYTAPFLLHVNVWEAAIDAQDGKYSRAIRLLDQAQKLAVQTDSKWGMYEVAYQRARVFRASGDALTARAMAQVAYDLASDHGWANRAKYVLEEFGLAVRHQPKSEEALDLSRTHVGSKALIDTGYVEALLRISLASTTTLDPEKQAQSALDELVKILNAERAYLFILGEDGKTLKLRGGRDAAGTTLLELKGYSSTVVNKVRDSGKPLVVSGTDEGEVLGSQSAVAHNLRSIIAAPLLMKERLLGVVYLDSRLSKGIFTDREVKILTAVCNHLAIAVETADMARKEAERREVEKDLALTAAVQGFFLPESNKSETGNVKLVAHYRGASQASGDWWWHGTSGPGQISALVGDVTGHGPAAAMLTASTAALFMGAVKRYASSELDKLLGELNDGFLQIARGKYSMTMGAVFVDGNLRKLRFWSAAAPPIFITNKAGETKTLAVPGVPLGSEKFRAGLKELDLAPGDRVFIFTDGVSELALPNGRPLKLKGVMSILGDVRPLPIEEASKKVADELDRLRGEVPLQDDLTYVLIDIEEGGTAAPAPAEPGPAPASPPAAN